MKKIANFNLNPYDITINSIFKNRKKAKIMDKYKDKSYYDRTARMAFWLFILSACCTLFSGYSEKFYLQEVVGDSIPYSTVAIAVTIAIIVVIEFVKRGAMPQAFAYYFKYGKIDFLTTTIVLVCISISIFCSFEGAKLIPEKLSKGPALLDVDSVKNDYDAQIAAINSSIAKQEKTTWKGNITAQANKNISKLNTQKASLIQFRNSELNQVKAENNNIIGNHDSDIAKKGSNIGYATLVCELLLLLIFGFLEYRDFTLYAIDEESQNTESTATAVTTPKLTTITAPNAPTQESAKVRPIGFHHKKATLSAAPASNNAAAPTIQPAAPQNEAIKNVKILYKPSTVRSWYKRSDLVTANKGKISNALKANREKYLIAKAAYIAAGVIVNELEDTVHFVFT